MALRVGIEIVLAVVVLIASGVFWQFQKRRRFLKRAMCDPEFLKRIISLDVLSNPPQLVAISAFDVYTLKIGKGYCTNIYAVENADIRSQKIWQVIAFTFVACLLGASYLLGWPFLGVNIALFFLSSLVGTTESTLRNALDHFVTLAVILHKWNMENPIECELWIRQKRGYRPSLKLLKQRNPERGRTLSNSPR